MSASEETNGHTSQVAGDDLSSDSDRQDVDSDCDAVGDTAFSKHFLFTTLLNTIKLINSEDNTSEAIELNEQSEEELCILWDMSVNEDVIAFLNENKAIDLFETIIIKTNSPRFAEISAGILANLAVDPDICANIASRDHFRQLVIDSLSSSDIPFVIQLVRLLSLSLNQSNAQTLWLSTIGQSSHTFFQSVQHTFENCLNCDLLKSELKLINKLLYLEDSIGRLWLSFDSRHECVKCLVDASNQLLAEDSDNIELLDDIWLSVHSLSLFDNNFTETKLLCNRNDLLELFKRYIMESFGDTIDFIIPSSQRAGALSAAIALVTQVLGLSTSHTLDTLFSYDLIQCLQQLTANCEQYLNELSESGQSEESGDKPNFQLALDQLKAIQTIHRIHIERTSGSPRER